MRWLGGIALFALVVTFQSCVSGQDWICECNDGGDVDRFLITNQPKSDAQKLCDYIKVSEEYSSCSIKEL